MLGQHLAELTDKFFLVADGEEAVADVIVVVERIVDRAVGRAFRPVEAELGRVLAGDVDRNLVAGDGQRPLVEEGQQVGRSRRGCCRRSTCRR